MELWESLQGDNLLGQALHFAMVNGCFWRGWKLSARSSPGGFAPPLCPVPKLLRQSR
jgi:hypothetical protein